MRLSIEVAPEDIHTGIRGSPRSCALALAIKRAGGFLAVSVCEMFIDAEIPTTDYDHGRIVSGSLPAEAVAWYKDFDLGAGVQPISFTIDLK